MKRFVLAAAICVLSAPSVFAAPASDVMAPIRQFVDGFNVGDTKSAYAAYAPGNIQIIDEFAPHAWSGPHAAQDWAADFEKNATAMGITDAKVTYGKPTRVEITGKVAYVVVPTGYTYKEKGKAMQEEGQLTAVLHSSATGWKLSAWTWAGAKPHAAK